MDREITLFDARKMKGDALEGIFELYAPDLYQYAFRLSNSAKIADQIVGDVFAKFIQQSAAGRYHGVILRTYLYEIAYSILVDEGRYNDNLLPASRSFRQYFAQGVVESSPDDQRFFEIIQQALIYNLTQDQRHVILLRFVEGFSLKETAAITGKKVNHVKVIQNRAIAALRKAIDNQMMETQTIKLFIRRIAQT